MLQANRILWKSYISKVRCVHFVPKGKFDIPGQKKIREATHLEFRFLLFQNMKEETAQQFCQHVVHLRLKIIGGKT